MARYPTRSEGGSNGSAHDGGNRRSSSGTTQSASNPGDQLRNDSHYLGVTRPRRDDHGRLKDVINHSALKTGSHSSYGVPHASLHGGEAGHYSFGNGFNAPHASQTQSGEANRAQSSGHLSYAQQILHQAPGYGYSEPYNAVGYIRRDGRVYDRAEVYEEYRPYEQVDRLNKNKSDEWINVQTNARRWT